MADKNWKRVLVGVRIGIVISSLIMTAGATGPAVAAEVALDAAEILEIGAELLSTIGEML
jgi:hypothetical protein